MCYSKFSVFLSEATYSHDGIYYPGKPLTLVELQQHYSIPTRLRRDVEINNDTDTSNGTDPTTSTTTTTTTIPTTSTTTATTTTTPYVDTNVSSTTGSTTPGSTTTTGITTTTVPTTTTPDVIIEEVRTSLCWWCFFCKFPMLSINTQLIFSIRLWLVA